jgi:hypothetical protein
MLNGISSIEEVVIELRDVILVCGTQIQQKIVEVASKSDLYKG